MKIMSKFKSWLPLASIIAVMAAALFINNIYATQSPLSVAPSMTPTSTTAPSPAIPTMPSPRPITPVSAPNPSTSPTGQSLNWAGYVANTGTFTSVSGTWIVPKVNNSIGFINADATWVGIGGINSRDLIQAGTQTIINSSGQPSYQAFIERLPRFSQNISLIINPGDSITVTISQQSPGQWIVLVKNNTTGESFQTTTAYASSLSSAEWIEEMPSARRGFIPLDNFGTIKFTDGSAIKNGINVSIAQSGAQRINMINFKQQVLATTSTLANSGVSFTVTRTTIQV